MCLTSCPNGYYNSNRTRSCAPCPTTCTSCQSFSNCSACATGFSLTSTYQCQPPIPPQCNVSDCISCNPNNSSSCEQCVEGFNVAAGQCVTVCPEGCYPDNFNCVFCSPNCSNCSATGCSLCNQGFELYNGLCYQTCPNGTIPVGTIC